MWLGVCFGTRMAVGHTQYLADTDVARGLAAASQFASLTQPDAFGAGAFRRASDLVRRCLRHAQISGKVPCGYGGLRCTQPYATTAFCQDGIFGHFLATIQ